MDHARFTRIDPATWQIEPHGAMRVPAVIYADENPAAARHYFDLGQIQISWGR